MIAPRLEIDLGKIEHNARILVERLGACDGGIQGHPWLR
jgi:predicted amino acid racemase